jgi:glucokinase
MSKILSADIGGTNSRFAHFEVSSASRLMDMEIKWLKTKEASSLADLLSNLKDSGFSLRPEDADIAVFAVAGPVEKNVRSSPPFISWEIDITDADKKLGIKKAAIINDFVAQAFACRSPAGEFAESILQGEIVPGAAVAVIGAGTGLGKATLVTDGSGRYMAVPSEGGHANFPFVSEKECRLQEYMAKKLGDTYITGNKVVSGGGLSIVHEFLTGEVLRPDEITVKLSEYPETLEWSSRFYGRVCRNYALETLALGGVYIAGGVAARNPELVRHRAFAHEFRTSDTLGHILVNIPVFLINDQNSGLWGGALYGLQKLEN